MSNQEKVNSLKIAFNIIQGKDEGEYIVIDSNEEELRKGATSTYQITILDKIKEQIAKDIESNPNLVNDEVVYKNMVFISASSVILQAPLAILKSGLKKYYFCISSTGKPKKVKDIKTMAKNLSEYFTDETTAWKCTSCKKESFAFEPIFICNEKYVCLKCVYEKNMNKDVVSIKYSNGGRMLNLLKTHFSVKSVSSSSELVTEINRMVGANKMFRA